MAQTSFNPMSVSTAPVSNLSRETFAERHGGWILAICLHVMLFALLFQIQRRQAPPAAASKAIVFRLEPAAEEETEPRRVLSLATEFDPAGDPESDAKEDIGAPENFGNPRADVSDATGLGMAATGNAVADRSVEQPFVESPATEAPGAMLIGSEPATEAQTDALDNAELAAEQAQVLEQLRRRAAEMQTANQVQGSRGSPEVEQLLRLAQTDQVGMKTLNKAPELREGVDREIDIKDVSLETAQKVLGQYGIKIMIMDLTQGPMPQFKDGYINRAVTNSGVMVRPQRLAREKYMAFTYGTIAEKQMAHLEEEALRARGFDPEKAQVQRIIFGIVPTTDGFDLGVTYMHAVPLTKEGRISPEKKL